MHGYKSVKIRIPRKTKTKKRGFILEEKRKQS